MITAETVNRIVRFQADGLPVVSLYCRIDPATAPGRGKPAMSTAELTEELRRLRGEGPAGCCADTTVR